MNAFNPLSPSQRQPDRAPDRASDRHPEPSMEEILASIRRIIADDQAMPEPTVPRERAAETAAPPPLRSLLRERTAEASAAASFRDEVSGLAAYGQVTAPQFPSPTAPSRDATHDDPSPDAPAADDCEGEADASPAAAVAPAAAPEDAPPTPQQDRPMRDQLARDPDAGHDPAGRSLPGEPAPRGGLFSDATDRSLSSAFSMLAATRLVDDSEALRSMAREMIRPLLKEWLDDNLPNLVERLVRAEIERVARGGR